MRLRFFVLLASIILFGSFFVLIHHARGNSSSIVISEIAAYQASGFEWIEITNIGEEPINIDEWIFFENNTNHGLALVQGDTPILSPGEIAVIVQDDTNFLSLYPNISVKIFDSSWGSLKESGEEIGLKNADGELIELFTYTATQHASLEKIDLLLDASNASNWKEHPLSNSAGELNYWGTHIESMPLTISIIGPSLAVQGSTVTFGASSSEDGVIISYLWTHAGTIISETATATYSFTSIGDTAIMLSVETDDGRTATTSHTIYIEPVDEIDEPAIPTTIPTLLINEFLPNPDEGNEWIELYNPNAFEVLLDGWELRDGVGTIALPTGTIQADDYVVVELSQPKINNGGDQLSLLFDDVVIDQANFGNWESSTKGQNASTPGVGLSLSRDQESTDTDIDAHDFSITPPTKGTVNNLQLPEQETETSEPTHGNTPPSTPDVFTATGAVVINELVSDPVDEEHEFVELFNTTAKNISLEGWWIEDGSETRTPLQYSIAPHGFAVIDSPKGNLNNGGDIVILYDVGGKEIDRVTYGTWDDGNLSDNAPLAKDPYSIARKVDGQDANNDFLDFDTTMTITKGDKNIITHIEIDGSTSEQSYSNILIRINEILPNPVGDDGKDEFIELYNESNETIDLTGFRIGDQSKKRYTITQGLLPAKGFLVVKRSQTGIALNNTGGDAVSLYTPDDALITAVQYTESAAEGESYAMRDDGLYVWTTAPTPTEPNIIKGKSVAPIIALEIDTHVFVGEPLVGDASDTSDPDGGDIYYEWDLGDGATYTDVRIEHVFQKAGVYTVSVSATDAEGNRSETEAIVTVEDVRDGIDTYATDLSLLNVTISEFLPNPVGSDTTEFIELFNPTDKPIDLSQLKIDDEEGGSRAYTIPDQTIIDANGYLVFGRQETKLALNNTTDAVRVLFPDGTILLDIPYDDVIEGASYQQIDGEWEWSQTPTPGEKNSQTDIVLAATKGKSNMIKREIQTTLIQLRNQDVGDLVSVTGTVAVEPGILGSQFFYIVSADGSTGAQIYSYKKEFPELSVGDRVTVSGEFALTQDEARIKIGNETDVVVLETNTDQFPFQLELSQIGAQYEGALLEIYGEITELKSSYMWVDDGTEEIKVYFKKGASINKKLLQVGDIVRVTGLLGRTRDGFQLLPRNQKDITKTGVVEEVVTTAALEADASQQEVAEKYLTATAGGLTSLLIGLMAKDRGHVAGSLVKKMGALLFFFRRKK